MSARKAIPVKVQVSVAIRQARGLFVCPLCGEMLLFDQPRVLEHFTPHATRIALELDPDAPENLGWVHKSCADRKTNGNKATCASGDTHKIAKAKRLATARTAHEAAVKKLSDHDKPPKGRAWPSRSLRGGRSWPEGRKIQSREKHT